MENLILLLGLLKLLQLVLWLPTCWSTYFPKLGKAWMLNEPGKFLMPSRPTECIHPDEKQTRSIISKYHQRLCYLYISVKQLAPLLSIPRLGRSQMRGVGTVDTMGFGCCILALYWLACVCTPRILMPPMLNSRGRAVIATAKTKLALVSIH